MDYVLREPKQHRAFVVSAKSTRWLAILELSSDTVERVFALAVALVELARLDEVRVKHAVRLLRHNAAVIRDLLLERASVLRDLLVYVPV